MAKHLVVCFYCQKKFDANVEPYVKVNNRRYAHKSCAEKHEASKTKEERDKDQLEEYIKQLFNISTLTPKIRKQIKTYSEQGYTYSGMWKTLKYFFEIRGNPIEKANEGIGVNDACYTLSSLPLGL